MRSIRNSFGKDESIVKEKEKWPPMPTYFGLINKSALEESLKITYLKSFPQWEQYNFTFLKVYSLLEILHQIQW